MPTLQTLRKQAGWTAFDLANHAGVSLSTVNRMESRKESKAVTSLVAYKVLSALSKELGYRIDISDVEGLVVKD